MRYLNGEAFWFQADKYKAKLMDASPDDLWKRECGKNRTKYGSATAVACGSALMLPTLGLALPGLVLSGRTLHIARTKRKMVRAEIERRNLPHYPTKKRDIVIPVGLALTVFATLGIIDIVCFTGTSSSVAFDASNGIAGAFQAMFDNPGEFFAASLQGFELQGQQFLGLPGAEVAIGSENMPVGINGNEHHELAAKGADPLSSGGLSQNNDFSAVGNGVSAAKADAAHQLRGALESLQFGGQHEGVIAADIALNQAAMTDDNQVQLAGISTGMMAAAALEKQVAAAMIEKTGLDKVAKDIKTSAGPQSGKTMNLKMKPKSSKKGEEAMSAALCEALTGSKPLPFIFLSSKNTPISQRIITPPPSQKCCHDKIKSKVRTCHFCEPGIDGKKQQISVEQQAYYHCCRCSTSRAVGFNICEVCVAARGCSCTKDRDHVLFRKGCLAPDVNFGKAQDMEASDDEDGEENELVKK